MENTVFPNARKEEGNINTNRIFFTKSQIVNILAKNVLVYLILAKKNIFEFLTSKGQVTQTAQRFYYVLLK